MDNDKLVWGTSIMHDNNDGEIQYWLCNNSYHRLDGPAIEYATGEKYYYLRGKHIATYYTGTEISLPKYQQYGFIVGKKEFEKIDFDEFNKMMVKLIKLQILWE